MRLHTSAPVVGILAAALSFGLACSSRLGGDASERQLAERPARVPLEKAPRRMLMRTWLVKGPPELSSLLGLGNGAGGMNSPDVRYHQLRQSARFREWEASGALTEFVGPRVLLRNGGEAEFRVGRQSENPLGAAGGGAPNSTAEGIRLKVEAVASRYRSIEVDLQGVLHIPAAAAGAISLKRELAAKINMFDGGIVALKVGDDAALNPGRAGPSIYCLLIGVEIQP